MYSERPKTERSIWKTEQNLVWLSDVRISDRRAVRFVLYKKLGGFGYKGGHKNLFFNIKRSILLKLSEIQTFGLDLVDNRTSQIRTIWQPKQACLVRNPNVRIWNVYCRFQPFLMVLGQLIPELFIAVSCSSIFMCYCVVQPKL